MSGCDCRDRLEYESLITHYAHYIDSGSASRVTELFTEDGYWESGSIRMAGTDAIRAGFSERETMTNRISRHVCTNVTVEFVEPDVAVGSTYLVLFRFDGSQRGGHPGATVPVAVGEYHDTFHRTPHGWRFARRQFTPAFVGQAEGPT